MNRINIPLLVLAGAMTTLPVLGQQVLTGYNPLHGCQTAIEGNTEAPSEVLVDGNDMTVMRLEGVSSASILFTLDRPFIAKGLNVVAGSGLEMTPSRMTLYGRNADSDDWTTIGRFISGVEYSAPYTAFTGRTMSSTTAYSSYKLEISRIKNGNVLEIAEVQLMGVPAERDAISTAENGSYSASDNVQNLWAADGSNLMSAVGFKNVKAEYGVENAWIQYSFDKPTAIDGYSLTANLNSAENTRPRAWELLGSDDGENWTTLDMRANHGNWQVDNYEFRRTLGSVTGFIDYATVADNLHEMIMDKFFCDYYGGKYLIHAWSDDPEKMNYGYNYWWMAHAIDAYIDAYIRTGLQKYQSRARQIRQGMYVAYDASRLDLWNSFYDDMEWMNLACIRGYENLKLERSKWLEEAVQLFDWIWGGWNYDDGSEGGIRWNSGSGTGKNSCSNAPAMIGAARLYQITSEQHYLDKAIMIFDWMLTHSRFDDGFIKDAPGNDNRGWAFSYNQGTWVGGLLELYRITQEQKYYDIAVDLMDKSFDSRWYSPDGIMREQGSSDGGLFKGIYIRYITNWLLSGYLDPERQLRYTAYLAENARSMYECALLKPELTVRPDWKSRETYSNGEPNGASDGSYHASIVLSGLFLCESMDMLRRAGLLDDDYSIKTPAHDHAYKHYRMKFTSNYGGNDVQIGAFHLYGESSQSSVADVFANSDIVIEVCDNCVIANGACSLEVYTPDGRIISRSDGSAPVALPHGLYIVSARSQDARKTMKIKL